MQGCLRILPLLVLPALLLFCSGCIRATSFHIAREKHPYEVYDSVFVQITGESRGGYTLDLRAFRVLDPGRFVIEQPDPYEPGVFAEPREFYATGSINTGDPTRFAPVAAWSHYIPLARDYRFTSRLLMPFKEPGMYVVEASAEGRTSTAVVIITAIEIIVKEVDGNVLAFVADRAYGRRIAGATVSAGRNVEEMKRSTTAPDGVARIKLPAIETSDTARRHVVIAEHNGSVAIALPFVRPRDYLDAYTTVYLHADRILYAPGDTIVWRAVIRDLKRDGVYALPAPSRARVFLQAATGRVVAADTVDITARGTAEGRFPIAIDAAKGTYRLEVMYGERTQFAFVEVTERQTDLYDVVVAMSRPLYRRGDAIAGTIEARSITGAPVAGAQVEYTIARRVVPPEQYMWTGGSVTWQTKSDQLATVHVGRGTLDAAGRLPFTFQPPPEEGRNNQYQITARVTDGSGNLAVGRSEVGVLENPLRIGVSTDRTIYRQGDTGKLTLRALYGGASDDTIRYHTTISRTKGDPAQRVIFDTTARVSPQQQSATYSFIAKGSGAYTVTVSRQGGQEGERYSIMILDSTDTHRLDTTTGWVSRWDASPGINPGETWYRRKRDLASSAVGIITDRDEYRVGDTIIAICGMYPSGKEILLTIEGERIHDYRVEAIGDNGVLLKIPVPALSASHLFLGIAAVATNAAHAEVKRIRLIAGSGASAIDLVGDSSKRWPADRGRMQLHATDRYGLPVPDVDLGLSILDEALYALDDKPNAPLHDFLDPAPANRVRSGTGREFRFNPPRGDDSPNPLAR